ncbi:MAG TPA: glycogen debranching N-terminal domain-containing protein, partial [Acidothermaceae bacterium]|nr:glycogen debranching N-terminal domain-containing protein [Acidothermaceae bacterium]
TRVTSAWRLRVNDAAPQELTVQHSDPYTAAFYLLVPPLDAHSDSSILIVRRRYIGEGMREEITLKNLTHQPVQCVVQLEVAADFADLFEVKEGRAQPVTDTHTEVTGQTLRICRTRGAHEQSLLVAADGDPQLSDEALCWEVALPPRGEWATVIEAVPAIDGVPLALHHPRGQAVEHAEPARRLREWRRTNPQVHTADRDLAATLQQSVEDLGALRIFDPEHPERVVVAAGAPWFMALFGRDSLLTSWMLLPLDSSLAVGTLQTLADHQGRRSDPISEEEPGRILHEIRFGPTTDFALGGRSVYYGTADATALFVMLLGELQRWGGQQEAVQALLPHADRALDWIERYGDIDGDGFVEYQRKSPNGLINQGWKDSWDGISFADGHLAEAPIALAEVQAYCYAAYRARAHFATTTKDRTHWLDKAEHLKRRFNDAFWLPSQGWFAVGLDRDKQPIDSLTSNIGHCLWTGIVDDDKATSVAEHLLSPEMFTGWGIRTLSAASVRFNPTSYHNGSVWPHDNAICAAGLMRYGFVNHAQAVITGLFDAARHFEHRLPELFCGFDRTEFSVPVPFSTSCSPQAWAAAAPLLLLRAMLRFDPELPIGQLWCAPEIPERYLPLTVTGLHVGNLTVDVDVQKAPSNQKAPWNLTGLAGTGVELFSPPSR